MKPEPPLDMFPARQDVWYAGVDAYKRGLPVTFDHPYCWALKDVWEEGWKAAAGERVDAPSEATLQQLIDAWSNAHNALRNHVKSEFPLGCDVIVDSPISNGSGRVVFHSEPDPHRVVVRTQDGSEWWHVVTSVRRIP